MLKKWVFSRRRKVVTESTVHSDSGREFQTKGPETQNALSPNLERVNGTCQWQSVVAHEMVRDWLTSGRR